MEHQVEQHWQNQRKWLPPALLLLLLLCTGMILVNVSFAASSNSKIQIRYSNNLIDIAAKNAEIKAVLLKLAEVANIHIKFPSSLEKKISINKQSISLRDALKRLLKDFNYIVIYSGPNKVKASVSKVFIYSEAEKTRRLTASQRLAANRIKNYERQIDSIKQRLSRVDQNSSRAKRYLRQIRSIESRINRLQQE